MKKIWIGIGCAICTLIVVTISIVIIKGGNGNSEAKKAADKNSPDSVVEQYGEILKKGNYGDIIDIAYFPDSVLITEEKLQEKKEKYFEEMRANNSNVIEFDYVKSTEDDEKISYKLTINGTETRHIDVIKPENKILIEDLYVERERKLWKDSTVTYNGVTLPKEETTDNDERFDTYKFIALSGLNYELKITHPFYKDLNYVIDSSRSIYWTDSEDQIDSWNNSRTAFKDEIKEQINNALKEKYGECEIDHYSSAELVPRDGYYGENKCCVYSKIPSATKKYGYNYALITLVRKLDGSFTIEKVENLSEG